MLIQIKTFNGHAIWDADYQATILNPSVAPNAKPIFIEESLSDSDYSGMFTRDVRNVALNVRIINYANREALKAQLKAWFKTGTRGDMVATFTVDGEDYLLPMVVQAAPVSAGDQLYTIILQSEATAWRAVYPDTDTWNLTTAGGTKTITVEGDDETRLMVTLTPNAQRPAGYKHQNMYQLVVPTGIYIGSWPWEISLDTAALIADAGNKCQINAVSGIGTGDATIPYDTVTGSLPSSGRGYVGSEQIAWTGKTGTTSGNLTGCTRGLNGTTPATHADNVVIYVSKMAVDCSDLRIWLDDQETRRWIADPNTNHTKIWFNIDLKGGVVLPLATAVAASGAISYLNFKNDANTQARLSTLPGHGILHHGTEWFAYSSVDAAHYKVAIAQRGLYNTTEQAHNVGDVFDFLPAAIRVIYGNPAVTAPALSDTAYDDTKPLFNLSSSDNTKWVWTATDAFYDPAHYWRPGHWVPMGGWFGNVTKYYWIKQDAASGNAAIGMKIGSWYRGGSWLYEGAVVAWAFYAGWLAIQKITVTGQKYRNTALWPDKLAAIQSSDLPTQEGHSYWQTVFNEAAPASLNTWTALTNDGVAKTISPPTRYVQAVFSEVFGAQANAYAEFEIQTCTIEFGAANIPTGGLLGEEGNYHLEITLANGATGDSLDLVYPMRLTKNFVVDSEANIATYDGGNAHRALSLNDVGRSVWMRLAKGSNVLTITAEATGDLDMALSWYRRRL